MDLWAASQGQPTTLVHSLAGMPFCPRVYLEELAVKPASHRAISALYRTCRWHDRDRWTSAIGRDPDNFYQNSASPQLEAMGAGTWLGWKREKLVPAWQPFCQSSLYHLFKCSSNLPGCGSHIYNLKFFMSSRINTPFIRLGARQILTSFDLFPNPKAFNSCYILSCGFPQRESCSFPVVQPVTSYCLYPTSSMWMP